MERRRTEELRAENLSLCLAQRRSMEESQLLGWELEQISRTADSSQGRMGGGRRWGGGADGGRRCSV